MGKKHQEGAGTGQTGRSQLTDELLPPGEDVTNVLDYDNVQEDPEITQAVAHIPPRIDMADVEMQDEGAPSGFKPKFGRPGYDVNLVQHSDNTAPGSVSPVTAQQNLMLDEESTQSRAPGTSRSGFEENTGRPITKTQ